MSVLQPDAYRGIQEALKQRADLAANAPPSTLSVVANTAGKAAGAYAGAKIANNVESEHQKDLEKFKFNLEDQLKQNEAKYKAQAEGKNLVTQDIVDQHYKQNGIDPALAPRLPKEGMWMSEKDIQNEMKHAQFRTQVQGVADQYSSSKDPADKRRADFLKIVGNLPDEKLDSVTDDIRKILVPESESKPGGGTPALSVDNFGRKVRTWPDGTTQVLNGAPKATPQGKLATEQAQLHPAELDNFKKGLTEFDTKAVKDSKQAFKDLDKLQNAVKENNPVSFFNSKIELVRLGGISAGRISQGEIVQEAGARDFLNQMQQKLQTFKQGDWTPENRKLIGKYIETLKAVEGEHVKNALEESVSKTMSGMPDPSRIDPDFVKKEFSKPVAQYLPEDNSEAEQLLRSAGKAVTPQSIAVAKKVLAKKKVDSPEGLVEAGTIKNLYDRKILKNSDGSYSTTSSMSFGENGKEILIPTVVDGKRLSSKEAIQHYRKTGEHLGKFNSSEAADKYAENLHNEQERRIERAKK